MESLVTGERQDIGLQNEMWVEGVGSGCLSLRVGTRNQGVRQAQPLRFECVLTPDGWSNVEAPSLTPLVSNGSLIAVGSLSSSLGTATCKRPLLPVCRQPGANCVTASFQLAYRPRASPGRARLRDCRSCAIHLGTVQTPRVCPASIGQ